MMYNLAFRLIFCFLYGWSMVIITFMTLDFLGHFGWNYWSLFDLFVYIALVLLAVGSFIAIVWSRSLERKFMTTAQKARRRR